MEGKGIIFNEQSNQDKQSYRDSQIENLQTSLASVTSQLLSMQETLGEKEIEINGLRKSLHKDQTLTIIQVLVNLYKLVFLPREAE